MASLVKFNGEEIIGDTEGGIIPNSFSRGIIKTNKEFIDMARGDGQFVKLYNKTGTSHSIEIEFHAVPKASIGTIHNRMQALADETAIGAFEVLEYGATINNCEVEDVSLSSMELCFIPDSTYAEDYAMVPAYHIAYQLTFRQLK